MSPAVGEKAKPVAIRLINWELGSFTCSHTEVCALLKTRVIKVMFNPTDAVATDTDSTTNKAHSGSHFAVR